MRARALAMVVLTLAMLGATGCFSSYTPDLRRSSPMTPTSALTKRESIRIEVKCEWNSATIRENMVGQTTFMIDPVLPIFIAGRNYVIPPETASSAFDAVLREELTATGFDVVEAGQRASHSIAVTLKGAHYSYMSGILIVIPFASESSRGVTLLADATVDTPEAFYNGQFHVRALEDVETPIMFALAWRRMAALIAKSTVDTVESERAFSAR